MMVSFKARKNKMRTQTMPLQGPEGPVGKNVLRKTSRQKKEKILWSPCVEGSGVQHIGIPSAAAEETYAETIYFILFL